MVVKFLFYRHKNLLEEQELRQIGEEKSCPVTKAGNTKIEEVNSAISVKESVLNEKARAVEENGRIGRSS